MEICRGLRAGATARHGRQWRAFARLARASERAPKDKPSKTPAAKALAKQIARAALRRAGPIGAVVTALEAGHWLYSEWPSIRSYQDGPKSLAELQQNAGRRRPGYENHHIVEQGTGEREGFSRAMLDSVDNVVSVPKYKHHSITSWYSTPNKDFGMQSPRAYLRGRDWSEHVRVGHHAMRQFGILKMTRQEDLSSLPSTEIVRRFEQLCIEQYDAMEREEQSRVNRLVWRIHSLELELKSRPGDHRRLLMRLFGHPNMQVRLSAAHANLAVDYIAARREMQAIIDERWFPQAGDAGMTLYHIDIGFYTPS